jgi:integral membrane protein
MPAPSIQALRRIILAEGVSFLILLFIAMPLKYAAGLPLPVKIAGWLHGLLFIALCALLLAVTLKERWPWSRAGLVFAAALLPFGPFLIDHRLKAYAGAS